MSTRGTHHAMGNPLKRYKLVFCKAVAGYRKLDLIEPQLVLSVATLL